MPVATVRSSAWRSLPALVSAPVMLIIAGMAMLLLNALAAGRLTYGADLTGSFLSIAMFGPLHWGFRRLGVPRLALASALVGSFLALGLLTALDSALLATHVRPYADEVLAQADARLFFGFHWPTMAATIARYPRLLVALSLAYASLGLQPALLIGLLAARRPERQGWTFVTAWGIALSICLFVFPWAPAAGGYVHYGITPAMTPGVHCASAWEYPVLLQRLRDGTLRVLDHRSLEGIIAMPSFHAAGAVLLGWGFWSFRMLRWPLAALNVAMWLSAVPIGGHYIVDVLAGTLVATISIRIAGSIHATGWTLSPSYPRRGRASPA